jgi:hypothetical protein
MGFYTAFATTFFFPSFVFAILLIWFGIKLKRAVLVSAALPAGLVLGIAACLEAINDHLDGIIILIGAVGSALLVVGGLAGCAFATRVFPPPPN